MPQLADSLLLIVSGKSSVFRKECLTMQGTEMPRVMSAVPTNPCVLPLRDRCGHVLPKCASVSAQARRDTEENEAAQEDSSLQSFPSSFVPSL